MWRLAVALLLASLAAADARACSIPVFRFALERWTAAPYELLVIRDRPLNDNQQACVQNLRDAQHANLRLVDVNLAVLPNWARPPQAAWRRQPLPLLALRAPDADSKSPVIWTGEVTAASVNAILDSPTRRTIVDQLGKGRTAVFLLLESGERARDEVVTAMLLHERDRLQREATLPEPSKEGPQPISKLPLKVEFPVVALSRSDPQEAVLLRMLLASEPGLEKVAGPIVFSIFGRGRLLAALHDDDLSPDELTRVAEFFCKGCTCQDKLLNPGIDLLFTADWQGFVDGTAQPERLAPPIEHSAGDQPKGDFANSGGTCGNRPGLKGHLGTALILAVLLMMGLVAFTALQLAWKSIVRHQRLRQQSMGGDDDAAI